MKKFIIMSTMVMVVGVINVMAWQPPSATQVAMSKAYVHKNYVQANSAEVRAKIAKMGEGKITRQVLYNIIKELKFTDYFLTVAILQIEMCEAHKYATGKTNDRVWEMDEYRDDLFCFEYFARVNETPDLWWKAPIAEQLVRMHLSYTLRCKMKGWDLEKELADIVAMDVDSFLEIHKEIMKTVK